LEPKLKKAAKKSGNKQKQVSTMVRGPLSCKAKGELGELAFAHQAAALGFGVAKPHGDNECYDFIVDSGERLWRVQVKSIYTLSRDGYRTACERCNHIPYKQEEIDFLVAYIAPLRIWYVIPANRVAVSTALAFYPSGCRRGGGRFEPYREAWDLMAPGGDLMQPGILRRMRAVACQRNKRQGQDFHPDDQNR
jgi:hypothetical protein